jgi:hypothetical protein
MITLDERPVPPPVPQFSRDMEQFLLTAARADTAAQPATSRTATGPATTRRRRIRYAAAGLAAAAVAVGVAVGIDYGTGGGPRTPSANPTDTPGSSLGSGVHIHLAAFSVDANPGGTVTLTIQGQLFDPNALREALAKAGVPAVVTLGSVCTVPGHPSNGLPQVISRSPAVNGRSVTTITPSAIPAGEKLSFGYFVVPTNGAGGLFISLVPDNAPLTCSSTPPAPPRHGGGPTR